MSSNTVCDRAALKTPFSVTEKSASSRMRSIALLSTPVTSWTARGVANWKSVMSLLMSVRVGVEVSTLILAPRPETLAMGHPSCALWIRAFMSALFWPLVEQVAERQQFLVARLLDEDPCRLAGTQIDDAPQHLLGRHVHRAPVPQGRVDGVAHRLGHVSPSPVRCGWCRAVPPCPRPSRGRWRGGGSGPG